MKKLIVILSLFAAPALAYNTSPTPKECSSTSSTHTMKVTGMMGGVQVSLEEIDFVPYGKAGSLTTTTKTVSLMMINGATMTDVLAQKGLISGAVNSMMRQRPEFDGEADMTGAYASNLVQKMSCY